MVLFRYFSHALSISQINLFGLTLFQKAQVGD